MILFYRFFYGVAQFFRNLAAVIIFLICLVVFQVFETQTLFYDMLDRILGEDKRLLASMFLSIAYEVAQLIFTANKDKVHKGAPIVIAIFSLAIHAGFFEIWKGSIYLVTLKIVASVFLSYLMYMYCHLFLEKWQEANAEQELEDVERDLSEKKLELSETERTLSDQKQQASELKAITDEIEATIKQLTCPHCGKISHTQEAHNAHVGRCKHKKLELVPT